MRPSVNPYQEYQSNQVSTADPKQLIIMLYDGAIRFLEESLKYIDDFKTYDKANTNILRAQDIIAELMVSLDMDKGGEIADNLFNLYAYMKKELLNANIEKKNQPIKTVIKLMRELKGAWEEMDPSKASNNKAAPKPNAATQAASEYRGFAAQG